MDQLPQIVQVVERKHINGCTSTHTLIQESPGREARTACPPYSFLKFIFYLEE